MAGVMRPSKLAYPVVHLWSADSIDRNGLLLSELSCTATDRYVDDNVEYQRICFAIYIAFADAILMFAPERTPFIRYPIGVICEEVRTCAYFLNDLISYDLSGHFAMSSLRWEVTDVHMEIYTFICGTINKTIETVRLRAFLIVIPI